MRSRLPDSRDLTRISRSLVCLRVREDDALASVVPFLTESSNSLSAVKMGIAESTPAFPVIDGSFGGFHVGIGGDDVLYDGAIIAILDGKRCCD
jgi:hypothetical protein